MATATWVDAGTWSNALGGVTADVYYGHGYHALHDDDGVTPACAVASSGGHRLIVPGLLHRIGEDEGFDLQTPNGYGGPLATEGIARSELDAAWEAFRALAAARGVVAAFFRLHPVLENERWLPADATVVDDRETVLVDLRAGIDAAVRAADSRFRNKVKRAERDGLLVRWNAAADWPAFERLYAEAMERLRAAPSLRFGPTYFDRLRKLDVDLGVIEEEGGVSAAAVFFRGRVFHYHLGARSPLPENRAMSYLFFEAMRRAVASGAVSMHVGGGATRAADDTLLRFKRLMSPERRTFKVARVVVDHARFGDLIDRWRARAGRSPSWLLGYREPID
jgi:hypothetical protein